MKKEDIAHLCWIYDRLAEVHGESVTVDYMCKFLEIIQQADKTLDSKIPNQALTEKDILMQEIQVLNETLYAFGEWADMKSTALVVEKLMILVNKLVPSE